MNVIPHNSNLNFVMKKIILLNILWNKLKGLNATFLRKSFAGSGQGVRNRKAVTYKYF